MRDLVESLHFIKVESSKRGKHALVVVFFFFSSKLGSSGSMYNKSFVFFSVVFSFRIKATHITANPSPLTAD